MVTETELLAAITAHLAATGETATAFGVRVAGDPGLVKDLRNGRSPRLRLAVKIMDAAKVVEPQASAA